MASLGPSVSYSSAESATHVPRNSMAVLGDCRQKWDVNMYEMILQSHSGFWQRSPLNNQLVVLSNHRSLY